VRLQSAQCNVSTRKGRRQARNDGVLRLDDTRFFRGRRTKRSGVPASRHRGCLEKDIAFERGFAVFSSWKREKRIGDKVARFRQVNTDNPKVHHDALEFPSGELVLVTRLYEGQHATVLQLPVSATNVSRTQQPKHAAIAS